MTYLILGSTTKRVRYFARKLEESGYIKDNDRYVASTICDNLRGYRFDKLIVDDEIGDFKSLACLLRVKDRIIPWSELSHYSLIVELV